MSPADSFRIMVVGNKHVGKSEQKYKTTVMLDGDEISVEISDSTELDENIISWADGFMIVYDITKLVTFEAIMQLKKELEYRKSAKNISYVVVGNKIDLNHSRQVPKETAEKLCLDIPAAHFECCACAANDGKETTGLREAFEELCREIKRRKNISVSNVPERRKSIIHKGIRMLVAANKSKQYSSPKNDGSGNIHRRSGSATLRRRKSVAGLIGIPDRTDRSRSPIPPIRLDESYSDRSQTLGRSVCRYGVDGLYVKP